LDKQTILLTGASGLLGKTLLREWLSAGHSIIGVTRTEASAEKLRIEFGEFKESHFMAIDLGRPESISKLIEFMESERLTCNTLVNAARNLDNLIKPDRIDTWSQFSDEFSLGVVGAYQLTMEVASRPHFLLNSVINVSSIFGLVAVQSELYGSRDVLPPVAYSVTKAALNHLTREMAVRLAPKIRVNAVLLGGIEGRASPEFVSLYSKKVPLGRMLLPKDLLGPFSFLMSSDSSGVVGHLLVVDGGWTLS